MRLKSFIAEQQFVLQEEVRLITKHLKTSGWNKKQVIDLGTVGWYHIYSITDVPQQQIETFIDALGKTDKEVLSFYEQIHTLKDYKKNKNGLIVSDRFIDRSTLLPIKEATKKIYSLGFRKQKIPLIIEDIERENKLTGGGVGGYASYKEHGISLDKNGIIKNPSWFTEALLHETAHMIWFRQIPKSGKAFFAKWFSDNIADGIKKSKTKIPENVAKIVADKFITLFPKVWGVSIQRIIDVVHGNDDKVNTDDVLSYLKQAIDKDRGKERDAFLKKSIIGKTVVGDEKRIPKFAKIKIQVFAGGEYGFRVAVTYKPKKDPNKWLGVVLDDYDSVNKYIEFTDTRLKSPKDIIEDIKYRGLNMFKIGWISTDFDVKILSVIQKDPVVGMYLGIAELYNIFFDVVRPLLMNAKNNFKADIDIAKEIANQELTKNLTVIEYKISKPEGNILKDIAHKLGIVPTSYSASNSSELWAETIAYMATDPSKVSKELKNAIIKVMSGK